MLISIACFSHQVNQHKSERDNTRCYPIFVDLFVKKVYYNCRLNKEEENVSPFSAITVMRKK